jgi:hypothetical protein
MARNSFFDVGPGRGALPEGRVPTTFEWNEFEERLDKRPVRFGPHDQRTGRRLRELPAVTEEQARARGPQLLAALSDLVREVAARDQLTDLVLVNSWIRALRAIDAAAAHVVEVTPTQEAKHDAG